MPILSGCFMLLNPKAIQDRELYDNHNFLYFEDWDLSGRRIAKYRTIYFPLVLVYHCYVGKANKSLKSFKIYSSSTRGYFKKGGWIFDSNRSKVNKQVLSQLK